MTDKEVLIDSINYIENLLNKAKDSLKGKKRKYSPLEIKDLCDIVGGFEPDEMKDLLISGGLNEF